MAQVSQSLLDTLSPSERQRLAKKARKQQLKKFKDWDKSEESQRIVRRSTTKKTVHYLTTSLLQDAVKRQDKEEVKELLGKGANPNTISDVNGFSLLHQCSVDNSWEVANLLILNGATVDHVDDQLWSPLHVACAYESEDMVSLLLENNANTCLLNVDNCFPVDLSNEEGIRDSIFEEMGKLGIGLDEMKQLRQQKATKMLDDLKRAPAGDWNPDSLDETGIAPIHVAAANGYGEVVKYLLKKKSNINLQDKEGYTALHLAVLFNQEKMVRFLLKKGANPRVETCGSETAMNMAEDDVIRQVLANSVTAAVRKEEMLSRFESAVNDEKKVDLKTDMSDLMHREEEPVLINNSKAGSHSGLSVSRDDDDFICNVKPSVYTRSFIRASAMAKLDEMFERETLPDRADLSEQEMVEVTDRVKKSSMKIKGMLKDSFKRKHTTPV